MKIRFRPQDPPPDLLDAPPLGRIDYVDCYGAFLPPTDDPPDVDRLARLFFSDAMPGWLRRLVAFRQRVAVRTGKGLDDWTPADASDSRPVAAGNRIGPWKVASRSATEIVFLEKEPHLDFAFSLRVLPSSSGSLLLATTLVEFHGLLGRTYFLPVKPFHRYLVPRHMDAVLASARRQAA